MTLQVNKTDFLHNDKTYHYCDVTWIVYQHTSNSLIIELNDNMHYTTQLDIQSEHTVALMLTYSRWCFNRI